MKSTDWIMAIALAIVVIYIVAMIIAALTGNYCEFMATFGTLKDTPVRCLAELKILN